LHLSPFNKKKRGIREKREVSERVRPAGRVWLCPFVLVAVKKVGDLILMTDQGT
jgi:hypothetical protein